MVQQHLLCGLLWVLFCVLHSVFASGAVKRKIQQWWPRFTPFYRLVYTLFAFVSLAVVLLYQLQMNSPLLYAPGVVTNIFGGLVGLAGLVLMAVCIQKYFLSLSGLKSLFRKIPSGRLMITGVHRFVRHPLYSGTFLAIWGGFIVWPFISLLIAAFIITGYTLLALRFEEEKLVAEFGEDYKAYASRVPRIIPSFRAKHA